MFWRCKPQSWRCSLNAHTVLITCELLYVLSKLLDLWNVSLTRKCTADKLRKRFLVDMFTFSCTNLFPSWMIKCHNVMHNFFCLLAFGSCVSQKDNTAVCADQVWARWKPYRPVLTMAKWDNSPPRWFENDLLKNQAAWGIAHSNWYAFEVRQNQRVW